MLKLFKRNMVLQVVLILAVTVVLWWQPLAEPPAISVSNSDGILYSLIAHALSSLPLLAVVLAILVLLAEGVALNLILADAKLVPQTTLLPTFLYILCVSASTDTLSPVLLVCAVLLFFLHKLIIHGTLLTVPTGHICSATALISICTMIYLPSAAFLATYLFIATVFRLYNWRNIAALILGMAAPYILLVLVLYMTDGLATWWQATADSIVGMHPIVSTNNVLLLVANLVLATVIVISLFYLWSKLSEKTTKWKVNATVVMLTAIGATLMSFCGQLLPLNLAPFAASFALCGTHLLSTDTTYSIYDHSKRRHWILESLFIIIILASLIC